MTESVLVQAFVRGLDSQAGWWIQKWPNTAKGMTQPCDAIGSYEGRMHLFEAKLVKIRDWENAKSKPILQKSVFRPGQIERLIHTSKKGCMFVWILLGVFNLIDSKTRVFMIPLNMFDDKFNVSWTLSDIEGHAPIELARVPYVGWTIPADRISLL